MAQWEAAIEATTSKQSIVVYPSGMFFTINGVGVRLGGNQARVLNSLCLLAGVGEDNSATYLQLVRKIWGRKQDSSFSNLKINLGALVGYLRHSGLREAIRTHSGVGYYWSPSINLTINNKESKRKITNLPPLSTRLRAESKIEEEIEHRVRGALKEVSQTLASKFPRNLGSTSAKSLMEAGFTKADVARMFGVSRAAVGNWTK